MNEKLVYVAGPITIGMMEHNVRNAVFAGSMIMRLGHAAWVPHLTVFQNMIDMHPYEAWIAMDKIIIRRCDALYRIPGASKGADVEVALAKELGIPVFYTEGELKFWLLQYTDPRSKSQEKRIRAMHEPGGKY